MELKIFPSIEALGDDAAARIVKLSLQAITATGRFTVALSGGSLPRIISPALTRESIRSQINWALWHVFFADERCVPLNHPDSNYHLAKSLLFDRLRIPAGQIYPIDPTLTPAQAATAYEGQLRRLFSSAGNQLPVFDLVLLGMGEDGHTASLFPNHPVLAEQNRWVTEVTDSPKPPPERVTMTLPVFNWARTVMFIVTGSGKAEVLPKIVGEQSSPESLPAGQIQPVSGQLYWYVDQAAAANLQTG